MILTLEVCPLCKNKGFPHFFDMNGQNVGMVLQMNKITTQKTQKIITLLLLIFAVLAGLFLFLAVRRDFDSDIGHFARGSVLFFCFIGFCLAALALCIGLGAWSKNHLPLPDNREVSIPQIFTAYSAALVAIVIFASNGYSFIKFGGYTLPGLAEWITLPGVAVFFVLEVSPTRRKSKAHAIAGIFACLSVNFMLFKRYFDFSFPLNSPIRNALTVMEAALLLFLLSETRSILDKNTPVFFSIASGAAVSMMGGIALGLLLVTLIVPAEIPQGISLLRCALCMLVSAYAASSLLQKRTEKE